MRRIEHERIRIGYLSGDLCTHAVGLLMADLLEAHDRSRFEIYAFDYSIRRRQRLPPTSEAMRLTTWSIFVPWMITQAAVEPLPMQKLMYCSICTASALGARPGILAMQPAPLQGTYLGFIGTTPLCLGCSLW